MQSPNPSSFKNFSKLRKKTGHRSSLFWLVALIGLVGVIGAIWCYRDSFLTHREHKPLPSMPPPAESTQPFTPKEFYANFEKDWETEEDIDQDMEGEEDDPLATSSDSELVSIFKSQEENHVPPLSDEDVWRKNCQKSVTVTKGKPQVAVIIEGAGSLAAADWKALRKIRIPLTTVFEMRAPKASVKASKAWEEGAEIVVKISTHDTIARAKHKFPRMMGVVSEHPRSESYLTISLLKGLMGGLPHHVFVFPLIQDKSRFLKSSQSILRFKPSKKQIHQFIEWVKHNKKNLVFVPLSQLYPAKEGPRKAELIDPSKIKEAHSYLA